MTIKVAPQSLWMTSLRVIKMLSIAFNISFSDKRKYEESFCVNGSTDVSPPMKRTGRSFLLKAVIVISETTLPTFSNIIRLPTAMAPMNSMTTIASRPNPLNILNGNNFNIMYQKRYDGWLIQKGFFLAKGCYPTSMSR